MSRVTELTRQVEKQAEEIRVLRLQLESQSTIDATTGLLNRNGIIDSVDVSLRRLERQQEPFAVVVITIDALEDPWQHESNEVDKAMTDVGAAIKSALRGIDRVGRLSGGTFVAVLPLTGDGNYPSALDRLKDVIQSTKVNLSGTVIAMEPRLSVVHAVGGKSSTVDSVLGLITDGRKSGRKDTPAVFRI
jgi:diguanylate cyclase (GGDEF)-like protein